MDVSAMKVTELRRELRARGLSTAGDKAQLAARLELAVATEADVEHGDDLGDLDLSALDEPATPIEESPPPSSLSLPPSTESKPPPAKKIVLNRAAAAAAATPVAEAAPSEQPSKESEAEEEDRSRKVAEGAAKPSSVAAVDAKTRLEMRAKRFGLATPKDADAAKEARKARFGVANGGNDKEASKPVSAAPAADAEALRRRAERFGTDTSKALRDLDNEQRLLRRKERFGAVAS